MPVNLLGRSVLKLGDFTPDEIRFLLRLSASLKQAKYGGYEQQRLKGRNIALAVVLGFFVVLFYALTFVQMGRT